MSAPARIAPLLLRGSAPPSLDRSDALRLGRKAERAEILTLIRMEMERLDENARKIDSRDTGALIDNGRDMVLLERVRRLIAKRGGR